MDFKNLFQNFGNFIRIFVFLTAIVFLIVHFGTVKGVFDYKTIYGNIVDSFSFSKEKTAIKVPEVALNETKKEPEVVQKIDSIEIPKIQITAPIIFIQSTDNKDYEVGLKKGVVHYSESVLPGQTGQTVILGHSAPAGWPKINYDWVFSKLNDLNVGDDVFIYYENHKYPYKVTKKYILKAGEDIPTGDLTNSDNMLVLISCWPPGVNLKRIAVEAELAL